MIKNGLIKLKRVTRTLHNFESTWDIRLESFINYYMIIVDFFDIAFPTFHRVFFLFYIKVCKLSKIYKWQIAILPLAINYHIEIITGNHIDIDVWALPQDWFDQYCSPNHILTASFISKKRDITIALKRLAKKKITEKVCQNFNIKGYTFKKCAWEHKCSDCGPKDYRAYIYTKPKQWELSVEYMIRNFKTTVVYIDTLLKQFISLYPYTLVPLRPNTSSKYHLINLSQPLFV